MEFINQKTNGRKEAAEKYEIVEEAWIVRACANLCYCLFNVCVYLPASLGTLATPPNTYFLYRWHENLFAPWRRERERQTLSVLSGLIFLSPDLIFIFVSAYFFVTQASLHLLSASNRFEVVVSYFFCLFSVSFFLYIVTTTWSGCSNRKCCPNLTHLCCRARFAFVRFHSYIRQWYTVCEKKAQSLWMSFSTGK